MVYLYEDEKYGAARRAVGHSQQTMAMLHRSGGGGGDRRVERERTVAGVYESPTSKAFYRQQNHAAYRNSHGNDVTNIMMNTAKMSTRYGKQSSIIEPLHDWPAMLGGCLLIIVVIICVSLVVHHDEIFAGAVGIIIAVGVALLWIAGVIKARRDVKEAEKALRQLSIEQRKLLGLKETEFDSKDYEYIDDDYGFGIAKENDKRQNFTERNPRSGEFLVPATSSARKRAIQRGNEAHRGGLNRYHSNTDATDDEGRWSEYIARWNEEEDEKTLRKFETELEMENKSEEEALGIKSWLPGEYADLSPFGRSPDIRSERNNTSPFSPEFGVDGRSQENNKSASNTPSPLPAAPLTYRPSPKGRTSSRQQGSNEFWPTDDDEREALRHLGISSTMWNEGPDKIREWISERMMKPLCNLCETSHLRVSDSLLRVAPREEWVQNFGLTLPLPSLANAREMKSQSDTVGASGAADLNSQLANIKILLQQFVRQQQQQQNLAAIRQALQALNIHLHLLHLLKGEYPSHLMAQIPSGYAAQRIQELSKGSCCSAFTWDSGSAWGSRVHLWTDAIPSDTHLIVYLFLAFIDSYSWSFPIDPISGEDIPHGVQGSLFCGELPSAFRGRGPFSAVLPSRPRERIDDSFFLICSPSVHPPQINVIEEDKYLMMLSGHSAAFHAILLLIVRARNCHGGCLGLKMNIESPVIGLQEILDSSALY